MQRYARMVRRLVRAGMSPAKATLCVTSAYKLSMAHMEALYTTVTKEH